jgi:hypothetical protein
MLFSHGGDFQVSINSPSGEGGEIFEIIYSLDVEALLFPLILLQAKAVRIKPDYAIRRQNVSINSPSGEGGE